MKRKGFTLVELLVVIAIISILLSILVPAIGAIREYARQVACRANLNNLGKAIQQYTSQENGSFPLISNTDRMDYNADMVDGGADNPFTLDESGGETQDSGEKPDLNMLENLNLLTAEDLIPDEKVFLCPSTNTKPIKRGESITDEQGNKYTNYKYGFSDHTGNVHIDYALQIGYDDTTDGINPAPLTKNLSSQMPIIADKPGNDVQNDLGKEYENQEGQNVTNTGTGYSHGTDGVNYLSMAGNAFMSDGTILCGWGGNNIYLEDMDKDDKWEGEGSGDFNTPLNSKYDSVLYHTEHPDANYGGQ